MGTRVAAVERSSQVPRSTVYCSWLVIFVIFVYSTALCLQIICVMAMLVRVLTLWPALAGLSVTVAIIPLTMMLGRLLTAARKDSMAAADARVKLVTEVITGEECR
jgi:hypothetical protein